MLGIDLNAPEFFFVNHQSESITPVKNILYSAAIALPESAIFSKLFEQDTRLSDNEILQRLYAYFADFNQPLAIDFQRISENKVLTIAAPKEKIKKLYDQAPKYLKITAIDSEAYAIARALKKTGEILADTQVYGFSYTENNKTKLYIFENNYLIYYGYTIDLFKKCYPDFNVDSINIIFLANKPYILALGLALRDKTDLNLLPWREENARATHRRGILFVTKAIIASLILSLVVHVIWNNLIQKNQFILQTQQTQTVLNITQKNQINLLQKQLLQLNKLKQQQKASIELLANLSHAMPEGVFLTQLDFNNTAIKFSGQAVTQTQVNTLMANLKNSKFIQNPVLNNLTADNTEPPYNFKFVISAEGKFHE